MWSLYDGCWFFFIYAFLGWCCEVVYAAAQHGVFVNRGFLNGPVCPIYGFGLCLVTAVLYPVRGNLALLFPGSVLLTSALELAAGFLVEKLFHHRWWDYSNRPLNIGGYVCLLFSLLWGLACVLVVDVVHPIIARFVAAVPRSLGLVLLCVFGVTLLLDLAITVMNVRKLNRRLCALDEAAERMRGLSDGIGGGLAGGTIAVKKRAEAIRTALRQQERGPGAVERRLLRAFPNLHSRRHAEALEELKRHLHKLRGGQRAGEGDETDDGAPRGASAGLRPERPAEGKENVPWN